MKVEGRVINLILKEVPLTRRNLIDNGVSHHYINKLIDMNILRRIERGVYEITSYSYIYQYGYVMLREKRFDKAESCFKFCICNDVNKISSYYHLIQLYLFQDKYVALLETLDNLSKLNALEANERNYLLYLLSNLTELPEKYKKEIEFLYFEDIRSTNDYLENKIRGLCLKGEFTGALTSQNIKMKDKIMTISNDFLHHNLILKIFKNKKELDKTVLNLVNEGKYEELLQLLDDQVNLTKIQVYIKKLTNILINIKKTEVIPKVTIVETDDIFEAIDKNNYSLAYELSRKHHEKKKANKSAFSILLNSVCDLIREINKPIPRKKDISLTYQNEIDRNNIEYVENYIIRIYRILSRKKGFMILDTYSDNFTDNLMNLLKLCPDLNTSIIRYDNEDHILIRYNDKKLSADDSERLILYASYALDYKDFDSCINFANEALQTENPNYEIYSILGYANIKKKNIKKARECFIAASCISRDTYMHNYADFILKLGGPNSKPIDFRL